MPKRARARDLQGLRSRHEALALQRAADDLDQLIAQVRQVAQGLVLDGAALAVAAPQQVGAIDLVLVLAPRGDDVRRSVACWHAAKDKPQVAKYQAILVTTNANEN
jgi:hypothetical protein